MIAVNRTVDGSHAAISLGSADGSAVAASVATGALVSVGAGLLAGWRQTRTF